VIDHISPRLKDSARVLERRLKKGAMPLTESGGYGVPRDMLPASKINFLGREMGCPSQSDAYLRVLYGDCDKPDYTYLATASATSGQYKSPARALIPYISSGTYA